MREYATKGDLAVSQIVELIGIVGLIIAVAVFVIVLVVCLQTIQFMGFTGNSKRAMAVCVAILSAIGVAELFPVPYSPEIPEPGSSPYHFLLLPYAALGLTLLLMLLLFFVSKYIEGLRKRREQTAKYFSKLPQFRSGWKKQIKFQHDALGARSDNRAKRRPRL